MSDIKTYNIGNIENAQFFTQSLDYQSLTKRIAEKREMFEYLQATGKTERALTASAELGELETELEQFKENVFQLYETFTKVEIDTARLTQAKAHFDKGEFREADAVLNAEEMEKDLDRLIERDQQLDKEKATVAKNRGQLSSEYLVKARLQSTFYKQPNRIDKTCSLFDRALSAVRTSAAVFEYAQFLHNLNQFNRASPLYDEALRIRQKLAREDPQTYLPDVAKSVGNLALLQSQQHNYELASTNYSVALQTYRELAQENWQAYSPYVVTVLNNLAILHQAQTHYELAADNYDEALLISKKLAQENPQVYLSDVAMTLNNLATLHQAQTHYKLAANNYDEALQTYRELAQENPRTYLPCVATTLHNLAIVQKIQNHSKLAADTCDKALRIRQELAQDNPQTYLPEVASTLKSLAYLQSAQGYHELAANSFNESLRTYRGLAQENPQAYLPRVALTLAQLSLFYQQAKPDKAKSVAMAEESITIAESFPQIPSMQRCFEAARLVLESTEAE